MDALSFEGVSKQYRGAREYRALRDDVVRAAGRLVGMRGPGRQTVRALEDVSLSIPEGQSFGLIGANGAGKTTALKLATRIAYPTSGVIRVRGRVGALIEVGTGMHPELTGRENVGLYGRILGLNRRDVAARFDRIVEFAGVGAAIDQPVKQYSSGMQLRLGFAVAAHLEPDVLLVDEAIGVGDASFQYRCVERMTELVAEGRTLVFVSHDMNAIESLCTRAVLLRDGRIALDGPAREVVGAYLRSVERERAEASAAAGAGASSEVIDITGVTVLDARGLETSSVRPDEPTTIRVHFRAHVPVPAPIFAITIADGRIGYLAAASMLVDGDVPDLVAGVGHVDCTFEHLPLRPRAYEIWGSIRADNGRGVLIDWERLRLFEVLGAPSGRGKAAVSLELTGAPVQIPYRWDVVSEADDAPREAAG